MVNTRPAVDPLASVIKEYRENPWVQKLSRDYRERKLNLEKTANNEQTMKIISHLKDRVMSDNVLIARESEVKKIFSAKVSDLEANKKRLESTVSELRACLDVLKKRDESSELTIQRLSVELQQCRKNAREYRDLKKTLNAEKKARLSLDDNYKALVAGEGLSLQMLKTISEKCEKALLSSVRYTVEKLDDGKEDIISREKEDENVLESKRKYENLDEIEFE